MDRNEIEKLRQIAKDARVGYWPSYLGLNSEEDRVNFLAEKVEVLLDEVEEQEAITEQLQ